jgi:glycerophosphoryl diester phosphodiesterase
MITSLPWAAARHFHPDRVPLPNQAAAALRSSSAPAAPAPTASSGRKVLFRLAAASALLLPGLILAATPARSEWNIVDHVPLERVIIQAHRGAGFLAEENTLAAFELGWKLGTYPESDVRTTRDGVIVAFHDATFDRVVKHPPPALKGRGVQHVTWEELSKLDVGAWKGEQFKGRRVSRMSDIFAAMKGRPERHLYLDIKQVDLKQLAAEVQAAGVASQVVLASPRPEQIAEWRKLVPQSDTLLWMRGSEEQLTRRIAELRKSNFEGITQLQIHIFPNQTIDEALEIAKIRPAAIEVSPAAARASANRFTLSDPFILGLGRELRSRNILFQSLPYTSDPNVYAQLLDLGLASFATDYPDVTLREIKAYYAARKK